MSTKPSPRRNSDDPHGLDPDFRDLLHYAIVDGRCPICNERRIAWRRWLPRQLVRLLLGRRLLITRGAKEGNRQHIWPNGGWLKLERNGFPDTELLNDTEVLNDIEPFLDAVGIVKGSVDWRADPRNILLVCLAHNQSIDDAFTNRFVKEFRRSNQWHKEMARAMCRARLGRLATLRDSGDRLHHLGGLRALNDYARKALGSDRNLLGQIPRMPRAAKVGFIRDRLAAWAEHLPRLQALSRGLAEEEDSADAHRHTALGLIVALLTNSYRIRREADSACWLTASAAERSEILARLVRVRQIGKAERFMLVGNALGPALVTTIMHDNMTPHEALDGPVMERLEALEARILRSFYVENAIDVFFMMARAEYGSSPGGWRRSSFDDVLHLIELARWFPQLGQHLDHLAFVNPVFKLPQGQGLHVGTRRMINRLLPISHYAQIGRFAVRAEFRIMRWKARMKLDKLAGARVEAPVHAVEVLASINRDAERYLGKFILGRAQTLAQRFQEITNDRDNECQGPVAVDHHCA